MATRKALVEKTTYSRFTLREVKAYLPSGYTATEQPNGDVLIEGEDNAGWGLDTYVIPRLASGLIFAKEIEA